MKRYTIEDVKRFVEDNSDCKLLTDEYKNFETKMVFRCSCGNLFETTFEKFKLRNKRQCNKCGRKKNTQKLNIEDVKRFIEIESNSGCKLISDIYVSAHQKLEIICKCGRLFSTSFNHFKSDVVRQCKICSEETRAMKRRLNYDEIKYFIEVESGSGCKLLSKTYKNSKTKIRIRCKCGNEFTTLFSIFRDYDKRECHVCSQKNNLTSKGELKIEEWMIKNGIAYDTQVTFRDCRNEKVLPFDFVVYNNKSHQKIKLIIEYDGKQHYGIGLFGGTEEEMLKNFERVRVNDQIKNSYCFKKAISLLRIPYTKYAKIDEILTNALLN